MNYYKNEFSKHGLKVAQVLLTSDDFRRRERFLNLRNVIEELLNLGVVPIVNENDSVSTFELDELNFTKKSFGDNDRRE
jgi:glutamate 5-kinase